MTLYAFIYIFQKPEYLWNEMRYWETQDAILSHFKNTFRQNQSSTLNAANILLDIIQPSTPRPSASCALV